MLLGTRRSARSKLVLPRWPGQPKPSRVDDRFCVSALLDPAIGMATRRGELTARKGGRGVIGWSSRSGKLYADRGPATVRHGEFCVATVGELQPILPGRQGVPQTPPRIGDERACLLASRPRDHDTRSTYAAVVRTGASYVEL
jgi:hypothetical protein